MATKTNTKTNDAGTVLHESAYCPECHEMGDYQGAGQDDTWTGTTRYYRYCAACDVRWSHKRLMPGRED